MSYISMRNNEANEYHSVSDNGTLSKSLVYSNMPQVLLVFLSMVSRIYREVTVLEDSPLKRQEKSHICRNHILGQYIIRGKQYWAQADIH